MFFSNLLDQKNRHRADVSSKKHCNETNGCWKLSFIPVAALHIIYHKQKLDSQIQSVIILFYNIVKIGYDVHTLKSRTRVIFFI